MPATEIQPTEEPKKRRGEYLVSSRVRKALELLASGECKTQDAAAKAASLTPRALSAALKRPNVQAYRIEMAKETLRAAVPKAARRVVSLMEQDSNQLVALRSASFTLASAAGIMPPPAQSVPIINISNTMQVGYVIDLSPQSAPHIRTKIIEHDIDPAGGVLIDQAVLLESRIK
jgi:hypothetical protein